METQSSAKILHPIPITSLKITIIIMKSYKLQRLDRLKKDPTLKLSDQAHLVTFCIHLNCLRIIENLWCTISLLSWNNRKIWSWFNDKEKTRTTEIL